MWHLIRVYTIVLNTVISEEIEMCKNKSEILKWLILNNLEFIKTQMEVVYRIYRSLVTPLVGLNGPVRTVKQKNTLGIYSLKLLRTNCRPSSICIISHSMDNFIIPDVRASVLVQIYSWKPLARNLWNR